jgi:predicted O-methyltransferase YrrM
MATEEEVTHLLGALCVALRPHRVLETGTYDGDTAEAMGKALIGYGHLDSLEIDPERAAKARGRVAGLPVDVHAVSSLDWTGGPYDLMFFDSDGPMRAAELRRFANPGAVWVLHDAKHPEVTDPLEGLRADGIIGAWIELPTPRGLAMGRFL